MIESERHVKDSTNPNHRNNPVVNLLTSGPDWYGSKSGYYEQLVRWMPAYGPVNILRPSNNRLHRVLGKIHTLKNRLPARDQRLTYLELQGAKRANSRPDEILHVVNVEANLQILRQWERAPSNVIGTIHMPAMTWTEEDLLLLRRCQSAIVLYSQELQFFESEIGKGRVKVVLHGVDTEFFSPVAKSIRNDHPRILFCGQWLRDFNMLEEVVLGVEKILPNSTFDFVIPDHARNHDPLVRLGSRANVNWLSKLSNEELLAHYRLCDVAIFPLLDCGANNALVECLACGIPIVATDVGGVRDYGGGSIFPLVQKGDAQAMVSAVVELLRDFDRSQIIGDKQRAFAKEFLSWPTICKQHFDAYRELM